MIKPKLNKPTTSENKELAEINAIKREREFDLDRSIDRRFKIIIVSVLLLFSLVWVNLYALQITKNEEYKQKLVDFTKSYIGIPSQRGVIYDRNGEILVSNAERLSIVYYPPANISSTEEWEMAKLFIKHFAIDNTSLYPRDLKDLYIMKYPDLVSKKITDEEWTLYYDNKLSDSDIYQMKLARITESEYLSFDDETKSTYIVYTLMNAAPAKSIKIIKNDCTIEEIAYLSENNDDFYGFDAQIYYDRTYLNGDLLTSLLGTVTTSKQGLSSDYLLYHLALGYSRNSVIGKTGIEQYYESLLKGQESTYQVTYDQKGLVRFTEIAQGTNGQDLYLSFDSVLQQNVERIVARWIETESKNKVRAYFKNVNIVIMNPNNGDVLTMLSMGYEDGVIVNDTNRIFSQAMSIGSIIKGATVYMGLSEGVIKPGEVIDDAAIKIKETPIKKSYTYLGKLSDIQALALSSNVYMFHVAMRLGGATYKYDQGLDIDIAAFDIMRNYYSQFGLGSLTGVDVPYEATGYKGSAILGGHLLDFAIGQYDTYTVMQLAQYISTIANGGKRIEPRLLLKATQANTDIITYQNDVTVLNVLDNQMALERVQKGFRLCVTNGLCRSLQNVSVAVAAKTGTAETFVVDSKGNLIESSNSLVVTYAPYTKPEIAIACGIPDAFSGIKSYDNLCYKIVNEIMVYYFKGR
ncbi:MAG: penicillin-binding protein 2 [Erysipelotrichaceae bacterium]|nr:penicillin-binding protein 2 [Erysipelotrichaceae bacterium]